MKKNTTLTTLCLSVLLSSSINAFDNKREGFMLSAGLGISSIHSDFKQEYGGWSGTGRDSEGGFATSFKIGYGFSEQSSLYLMRNSTIVEYAKDPNNNVYENCMLGIGANYYLEPEGSVYLMGGIGLGRFTDYDDVDTENIGQGFMLGLGYEVSPHLNLEVSYMGTRIDDNKAEVNTDTLHVTFNYYWY